MDDENEIRQLMARWLASSGYDVHTAANADEAMHQVRLDAPAVALCDIRMPGRDGVWLAKNIRHDAPETAVIMATGVQDVTSAVTSLRQGVIDYLTKPFGRDQLRESVSRGIEWHKSALDSRRWREALEGEIALKRQGLIDALGCADHRLRRRSRRPAVPADARRPRRLRACLPRGGAGGQRRPPDAA